MERERLKKALSEAKRLQQNIGTLLTLAIRRNESQERIDRLLDSWNYANELIADLEEKLSNLN